LACILFLSLYGMVSMNYLQSLPVGLQTVMLLVASNVFMTFAWYGHLKNLATSPWYMAALVSWGIALFEYLLQVPANRIGYTQFNVGQLKIMQEVITLSVFVPFAVFYLDQPLKWDYLWAAVHGGCGVFHLPQRVILVWRAASAPGVNWRAVKLRAFLNVTNWSLSVMNGW
jgi:uncharacterized protein (DUF486 family)